MTGVGPVSIVGASNEFHRSTERLDLMLDIVTLVAHQDVKVLNLVINESTLNLVHNGRVLNLVPNGAP